MIAQGEMSSRHSGLTTTDGRWLWFGFDISEDDPKPQFEGQQRTTRIRMTRADAIAFCDYVRDQIAKEQVQT
jgi:hypothetical protein